MSHWTIDEHSPLTGQRHVKMIMEVDPWPGAQTYQGETGEVCRVGV